MNNDPCMYHVSFLFSVGDGDEGGKTERSERRQACETRLDRRRLSRERGKGRRGEACDGWYPVIDGMKSPGDFPARTRP
jgi:hypothetical protein